MLRVNPGALKAGSIAALAAKHALVLAEGTYIDRVTTARQLWDQKTPDHLYVDLKGVLRQMCPGNERCVYCEDSEATHIEHRRPKSLYPLEAFIWDNFLFACLTCNSFHKISRYANLVQAGPGAAILQIVTRGPKAPVVPPNIGYIDAFLNQRLEDPLLHFQLDLDTFHFTPISTDPNSEDYLRAKYTIDLVGLNRRSTLVNGRKTSYDNFLSRLRDYSVRKPTMSAGEIVSMQSSIRLERHITVWEEMKRQRASYGGLNSLFQVVPETLLW